MKKLVDDVKDIVDPAGAKELVKADKSRVKKKKKKQYA